MKWTSEKKNNKRDGQVYYQRQTYFFHPQDKTHGPLLALSLQSLALKQIALMDAALRFPGHPISSWINGRPLHTRYTAFKPRMSSISSQAGHVDREAEALTMDATHRSRMQFTAQHSCFSSRSLLGSQQQPTDAHHPQKRIIRRSGLLLCRMNYL